MRIRVLAENTAKDGFLCEHGLSLYVETEAGRKILFDMGQSDLFAANAEALLEATGYEIVTARTIVTDIDTLLASDRVEFSHTFKEELVRRIEHYDAGVEVTNVVLESIHPPVNVADVYQELISAEIDAAVGEGKVIISNITADIENGFVLSYGDIEVNCTFKALFDEAKDELKDIICPILF